MHHADPVQVFNFEIIVFAIVTEFNLPNCVFFYRWKHDILIPLYNQDLDHHLIVDYHKYEKFFHVMWLCRTFLSQK